MGSAINGVGGELCQLECRPDHCCRGDQFDDQYASNVGFFVFERVDDPNLDVCSNLFAFSFKFHAYR